MFEKEAEKYAENNAYKYASDYISCQEAYKDGAEFGYNKANIVQYAEENLDKAFKAIAELEKENAELKEKISILLSCKNCPENKGSWICAKEYENKCLAQKNKIIADFITGENRQVLILFVIDEIKKYKLKNRIKIALSILRGACNG